MYFIQNYFLWDKSSQNWTLTIGNPKQHPYSIGENLVFWWISYNGSYGTIAVANWNPETGKTSPEVMYPVFSEEVLLSKNKVISIGWDSSKNSITQFEFWIYEFPNLDNLTNANEISFNFTYSDGETFRSPVFLFSNDGLSLLATRVYAYNPFSVYDFAGLNLVEIFTENELAFSPDAQDFSRLIDSYNNNDIVYIFSVTNSKHNPLILEYSQKLQQRSIFVPSVNATYILLEHDTVISVELFSVKDWRQYKHTVHKWISFQKWNIIDVFYSSIGYSPTSQIKPFFDSKNELLTNGEFTCCTRLS